MTSDDQAMQLYEEAATLFNSRGQALMRDRYLVLASHAAVAAGRAEEAERLRNSLLRHNPHHLLTPFASMAEAMASRDVRKYVEGLRNMHPPESAQEVLRQRSLEQPRQPPQPGPFRTTTSEPPLARKETEVSNQQQELKPAEEAVPRRLAEPPSRSTTAPRPEPAKPRGTTHHAPAPSPHRLESSAPRKAPAPAASPYLTKDAVNARPDDSTFRPEFGGAWLSSLLFLLVLLAGLALAGYQFVLPFLNLSR